MSDSLTRKQFLRASGGFVAGSTLLSLAGCSSPTDPKPPVETPKTNLGLQLINAETQQTSPGYIIFNGSTQTNQDGLFDLDLEGNQEFTIQSGLGTPNDPQSYLRTIRVNPTQSPNVLSLNNPHTDFIIRDASGKKVGDISKNGYDLQGPMDVTRFKGHMREAHFYANMRTDSIPSSEIFGDGKLVRWTLTANGFGPERIIFTDNVRAIDGTEYAMDEADLLYETFRNQFESLVQPLYSYDIPFNRVDFFDFQDVSSVKDIVLIHGNADLESLAGVAAFYDGDSSLVGARIGIRTPIPDKETYPNGYHLLLDSAFSHEFAAGYNVTSGRPEINTRLGESILQQGKIPSMPESLPLVDQKAAGIVHNLLYDAGTHIDDLMGMPDGFVDPGYDLS